MLLEIYTSELLNGTIKTVSKIHEAQYQGDCDSRVEKEDATWFVAALDSGSRIPLIKQMQNEVDRYIFPIN